MRNRRVSGLLITNSTISSLFFITQKICKVDYHGKNTGFNMLSLKWYLGKRNVLPAWIKTLDGFFSLIKQVKKQTRFTVASSEDASFYILCTCSLSLAYCFFFCFQPIFCLVKSKDIFPCMSDYAELCHMKVIFHIQSYLENDSVEPRVGLEQRIRRWPARTDSCFKWQGTLDHILSYTLIFLPLFYNANQRFQRQFA